MARRKNLGKRLTTFHIFRACRGNISVINFRIKKSSWQWSHLDRKCVAIIHILDLSEVDERNITNLSLTIWLFPRKYVNVLFSDRCGYRAIYTLFSSVPRRKKSDEPAWENIMRNTRVNSLKHHYIYASVKQETLGV